MAAGPTVVVRSRGTRMVAALGEGSFRAYLAGILFAFLPMQMQQVAQGYLAYTLTESATALGLVQLAWGVPQLGLTLFAGVLADRYERRRIIAVSQGLLGLCTATIAVLVHSGAIQYWQLVVLAFLQGSIFAFNVPARQGMLPLVVSEQNLANAVALNNSGVNLTRVLGPGLAGVLIAVPLVGVAGVYDMMAASYFTAAFLVGRLAPGRTALRPAPESVLGAIAGGFRFIRRSPVLPTLIGLAFVPILLGMPYQTLMPVFALQVMDVGSPGLGTLMMLAGLGALGGSLTVAAFADYPRKARLQLVAVVAFGLLLFVFAISHNFVIALVLMPFIGGMQNVYMALNSTLLMTHTDRQYLGRVMGVYMVTWSMTPVTTLPIAAAADHVGAPAVVATLGLAVALLIGLANPRYRLAADRPATLTVPTGETR
ncbi:MAG: MFS transporter [Dehalococcoidia bacterium]|nr:MAG: MFS transporter [Dehalococcoidia bacterium]